MTTTTPARKLYREGLTREVPFTLSREDSGGSGSDGLTLEGHAAVFNARTVINSWEGRFTEEVLPGAFRRTFRAKTPVLQFDHGQHPMLGSITLGRFIDGTPKEDDTGAFIRARLFDNWLVQPVRDAIEGETITGMSFRFSVVKETWTTEDGKPIRDVDQLLEMLWDDTDWPLRSLREIKVPELGPVVFPQYEEAQVSVRGQGLDIDALNLEEYLQDNPEEGKTLARALFAAERATLERDSDGTDSLPEAHSDPEAGDSQRSAALAGDQTEPTADPTAAAAERMRARMATLNRSSR